MTNRSIIFVAVVLVSIAACGDKTASEASKQKEHLLFEQQRLLKEAKEVRDAADEAAEKQKKALDDLKDK